MNNRMKRLMLICIIIAILIIIIIVALLKLTKKGTSSSDEQNIEIAISDKDEILDYMFYQLTDLEEYVAVENSINTYINACKEKNVNNVLKLLNSEYVKEKNIDTISIFEKIKNYPNFESFFIDDIYFSSNIVNNNEKNYGKYYVYGTVWNNSYNSNENALFQVNIDLDTYAFDIVPLDISTLEEKSFKDWIIKKQSEYIKEYNAQDTSENAEEEITDMQNAISTEENITEDELPEEIGLEEIPENEDDENDISEEDIQNEAENTEINYLYAHISENIISERIIKKEVVNCIFNNGMDKMYSILTDDCKNTYFKNLNDFSDFITKSKDTLLNLKITNAVYQESETESDQFSEIYNFTVGNSLKFTIYANDITDYKISISK